VERTTLISTADMRERARNKISRIHNISLKEKGRKYIYFLPSLTRTWRYCGYGRLSEGKTMTKQRVPPVSAADQTAFKAATPALRKALQAIRRDRLKHPYPDELRQRLALVQERLIYWEGILMVGSRIRSPVALWDTWNKLERAADIEASELDYIDNNAKIIAAPRSA
jgi:hypothetical protein